MIVLLTGSRAWTDRDMMKSVMLSYPLTTLFVHGGAGGADKLCTSLALALGFPKPHVVRPDYDYWVAKIGNGAGHKVAPTKRNELMLDGRIKEEGQVYPDLIPQEVIAFFVEPVETGGTARCVEQARLREIPVLRFSPYGPF
jgi:hypothetical protein